MANRGGDRPKKGGGGGGPWLHGVALLLTAAAGYVDAAGYLLLAHVFVANMSGNSIAVGLGTADARWPAVVHRGYPIACFVAGLLLGGALAEGARRTRAGVKLGWAVLAEVVLLAAFLAYAAKVLGWHGRPRPIAAADEMLLATLAAVAMGVQNVSLRASGALGVYTTHVTGSLTQLADEAVRYGYWVLDHLRRPGGRFDASRWRRVWRASPRHPSFAQMLFLAGIWCAFVVGAAAGAVGLRRWGVAALAAPPVALALLAVVELTSGRTATRFPGSTGRRERSDRRSLHHGHQTE